MFVFKTIIRLLTQNAFNSNNDIEKATNFYNGWVWAYKVWCWKTKTKADNAIIQEKNSFCKNLIRSKHEGDDSGHWESKLDRMIERDFELINRVFELLKGEQPTEFIESLTKVKKYKGCFAVEKQSI